MDFWVEGGCNMASEKQPVSITPEDTKDQKATFDKLVAKGYSEETAAMVVNLLGAINADFNVVVSPMESSENKNTSA